MSMTRYPGDYFENPSLGDDASVPTAPAADDAVAPVQESAAPVQVSAAPLQDAAAPSAAIATIAPACSTKSEPDGNFGCNSPWSNKI